MPEPATLRRAQRDQAQGKAPSTQAGEFVREELDHIRAGEHGARSAKQAIAIGLSKARRAGVKLPPPKKGTTSRATRKKAKQDLKKGRSPSQRRQAPSRRRSQATLKALRKESRRAASHRALSRQAHQAARKRGPKARAQAARKAAHTRERRQAKA